MQHGRGDGGADGRRQFGRLRGVGEQSLLTLEIRDYDQLDTVVERLTRR